MEAESNADRAAARIEAFLTGRRSNPSPDIDKVLANVAAHLLELFAHDIIAEDAVCRGILADLTSTEDIEVFAADIDRLYVRAGSLIANLPAGRRIRRGRAAQSAIPDVARLALRRADPEPAPQAARLIFRL